MTATKNSYRVRIVPTYGQEIVTNHATLESAQQAFRSAEAKGCLAYSIQEVKEVVETCKLVRQHREHRRPSNTLGILAGVGTLVCGAASVILVIEFVTTVIRLFI